MSLLHPSARGGRIAVAGLVDGDVTGRTPAVDGGSPIA